MADETSDEGFTVRDRRGRSEPDASPGPAPPRGRRPTPPPRGEGARSLTGLFVMLASFAAAAMGEVPDASGQVRHDPEQAAEIIDLLMLLREKTEGHRTAEETEVLGEILYDLQIRWINAQRRSGS
jgi:hypothetical protein